MCVGMCIVAFSLCLKTDSGTTLNTMATFRNGVNDRVNPHWTQPITPVCMWIHIEYVCVGARLVDNRLIIHPYETPTCSHDEGCADQPESMRIGGDESLVSVNSGTWKTVSYGLWDRRKHLLEWRAPVQLVTSANRPATELFVNRSGVTWIDMRTYTHTHTLSSLDLEAY